MIRDQTVHPPFQQNIKRAERQLRQSESLGPVADDPDVQFEAVYLRRVTRKWSKEHGREAALKKLRVLYVQGLARLDALEDGVVSR